MSDARTVLIRETCQQPNGSKRWTIVSQHVPRLSIPFKFCFDGWTESILVEFVHSKRLRGAVVAF